MPASLLATLLDFRFTSLVTTKIIRLLYVLSVVVVAVSTAASVVIGFKLGTTVGAVNLVVVAPLMAFCALVYARVVLEFVIALFRIMENTQQIAQRAVPAPDPAPSYNP